MHGVALVLRNRSSSSLAGGSSSTLGASASVHITQTCLPLSMLHQDVSIKELFSHRG